MMRPIREIHFVPDIKSQSYRSDMSLQPASWIKTSDQIVAAKPGNRTGKSSQRSGSIVESKIYESALRGHKRLDPVRPQIDARPEQPMQYAQIGALKNYVAVRIVGEPF